MAALTVASASSTENFHVPAASRGIQTPSLSCTQCSTVGQTAGSVPPAPRTCWLTVTIVSAISAARPGARRDTVEFYLKRLEALEDVANSFPGVQKSYAIQAGREVRILVSPDEVDDVEAASLARNVVKKIEENLVYPGEIRVTVVRETRSTEVAH